MKHFDRNRLNIKPLAERRHDIDSGIVLPLKPHQVAPEDVLATVASDMITAQRNRRPIIAFVGGHVVRSGIQRYLIDLMQRGYVSCIAMNGAVMIHDFELALAGATTESVSRYIKEGQFGLWRETSGLNDIINDAWEKDGDAGMGESVGRFIENSDFPCREISILAAAYRLGIPATVHVGIGQDIIHEHPNCNGAATGALSYNDFLRLAGIIGNLEGGVVMNFGSAVMAPEVYLKTLAMARNVAHREGRDIRRFTTLVCDLARLPEDLTSEPPKDDPAYYFRPLKTMLIRTVADGGNGYYRRGLHSETIPALWSHIAQKEGAGGKSC